ncbi:MAG TPA: hypothetical protein VGG97_09535 [Bryobacteraceae bacterium]|jgi:hypothetical protein
MSDPAIVINESLRGFPHYVGFCLLCGEEMLSRTCHVQNENGMCLSWQDDEYCCIPGGQTHNCEMGRLLRDDKEEFERRREAGKEPDPIESGPFSEIPADERIWLAHRLVFVNARDEADQSRISHHWWNMLSEDGSYMLPQDLFDRAL